MFIKLILYISDLSQFYKNIKTDICFYENSVILFLSSLFQPRDSDDNITFLLEREEFEKALKLAETKQNDLKKYTVLVYAFQYFFLSFIFNFKLQWNCFKSDFLQYKQYFLIH